MLSLGARAGLVVWLLTVVPSLLLVGGGLRMILNPDLRGAQHAALGSVLGAVMALPVMVAAGAADGVVMLALSLAAFVAGGWYQIRLQPRYEGIPAPAPAVTYAAAVAVDDAFLSFMCWLAPLPTTTALDEAVAETRQALEWLDSGGYLDRPEKFHRNPHRLESLALRPLRVRGFDCEYFEFDSEFEPASGLPGRQRWLGYDSNRIAHGLLLRRDADAPWLVCVHGFGMGSNMAMDFSVFRAGDIHQRDNINIAMFVLPVHGPRASGGFNGAKFMGLSPLDFVHAESHAIWDLRRLIGWLRQQGAPEVGVYGISLGGYTSALLSCIENDLACVITGVPPSDVVALQEHLGTSIERRLNAAAGLDMGDYRRVQSVVSPLAMTSKVARDNRFMYAATGDQFVPIEQIRQLWQHWQQPRIRWSTGGHVTALQQRVPRQLVDEAIAETWRKGTLTRPT